MIIPLTLSALAKELENIGVHPASIDIFSKRSEIIPLKFYNVRMPAANIIKQELLSSGADCAVNSQCITGKVEYTDILLLGTVKHYYELLRKLEAMAFFGIPKITEQLLKYLELKSPSTVLADGRVLDYKKMCVMGIMNMTPDSFFAGSRQDGLDNALFTAETMLQDGAEILDIGGESTRPGAQFVDVEKEQERILPIIEAIKKKLPQSIISVDTYNPETMQRAIDCGADVINDITGAVNPLMVEVALKNAVPIIIMHMQGTPDIMQDNPYYKDVVKEVAEFLQQRSSELFQKGISEKKVIIDPGIGFGKTIEHNLTLINRLKELKGIGLPILLAASRKKTIGDVLGGLPAEERLEGTIALSCQAVVTGAQMVRVHDVKENVRAIRMLEAVRQCP